MSVLSAHLRNRLSDIQYPKPAPKSYLIQHFLCGAFVLRNVFYACYWTLQKGGFAKRCNCDSMWCQKGHDTSGETPWGLLWAGGDHFKSLRCIFPASHVPQLAAACCSQLAWFLHVVWFQSSASMPPQPHWTRRSHTENTNKKFKTITSELHSKQHNTHTHYIQNMKEREVKLHQSSPRKRFLN